MAADSGNNGISSSNKTRSVGDNRSQERDARITASLERKYNKKDSEAEKEGAI